MGEIDLCESVALSVVGRVKVLAAVLPETEPDRRQDDLLETGRTQLHPVLSDRGAGRAEEPEGGAEGRCRKEGRRDDQDEEVDQWETRGVCEPAAESLRLAHRQPETFHRARRWPQRRGGGHKFVDCEVVVSHQMS